MTSGGVLRGFGETRSPMFANLVGYWVLGFPVSLWLGFKVGLGPRGLWWGFVVGLGAVGIFLISRVREARARAGTGDDRLADDARAAPARPYAVAEHGGG